MSIAQQQRCDSGGAAARAPFSASNEPENDRLRLSPSSRNEALGGPRILPPSVDLVFHLPPPYGGVGIHVRRFSSRLRRLGVDCRCYRHWSTAGNPSYRNDLPVMPRGYTRLLPGSWLWFFRYDLLSPKALVHCHYEFVWSTAILGLRARRRPVVMTIHNTMSRYMLSRVEFYERWAARRVLADRGIRWIAVSEAAAEQLEGLGVLERNLTVIPAYLPPEPGSGEVRLPEAILRFGEAHSPLLSVYGYEFHRYLEGRDLYGLDICCEALKRLKEDFPGVGLVICLPNYEPGAGADALREQIHKLQIDDAVLIWTEPIEEAWPLWARSDVYVRPSATDGDSLAVREALDVGCSVVASDAARRPEGTFLHRTGDAADLHRALLAALRIGKQGHVASVVGEKYFQQILRVYESAGSWGSQLH